MSFRSLSIHVSFAAICVSFAACGDDATDEMASSGTDAGAAEPDAAAMPDAHRPPQTGFLSDAGDGWLTLIEAEWELPANTESYVCARVTVPRDVYLNEFTPITPFGTHHTLLSLNDTPDAEDGVTDCGAGENGRQSIYGSGVGTEPRTMPEGIAMRLPAGSQLLLNLHLFNSTDEPIPGRSGTLVRTVDEADVEHVAEGLLAGPLQLEIPTGRVTQTGRCTFQDDSTIIGVGPHMHQTGVYMKVVANSSEDGEVVLFDGPYDFESQLQYPVDFVRMREGDTVEVECTYQNDSGRTIGFGDSSTDEMCFAGVVRFPAQNAGTFICTN